jgi:hypothetical protein
MTHPLSAAVLRSSTLGLSRAFVHLAAEYGWYGYRRITALLNQQGWTVNHQRVERIWR